VTDQELRAIVRAAVARHLGAGPVAPPSPELRPRDEPGAHPSHARYLRLVNTTEACLIEPAVGCTHCGYCQSHGH
jgi:hypothetical protein